MRGYVLFSVLRRPQWPTFIAIVSNDFLSFNCFFWFRFALDTKHAAFAPLCCTCTCEESDSPDRSVRERNYMCWSHRSIHFLKPQQSPRMKLHFFPHQWPIPGYFGISCVHLLVLFEVFLQWILANEEQETGICLRHETAVQLSCESVVVGGTVLHTHAYANEGRGLRSAVRADWLYWRMLEPGVFWLMREWKELCVNLFPKKPYSCNIIEKNLMHYCCIILTIIFLTDIWFLGLVFCFF